VLVTHLANKHINATASNSRHGLSDCLFAKTDDLDETISSIADQLDSIQVGDDASLQGLLAKVKRLGINEIKKSSS
jgi:hypothetical protein